MRELITIPATYEGVYAHAEALLAEADTKQKLVEIIPVYRLAKDLAEVEGHKLNAQAGIQHVLHLLDVMDDEDLDAYGEPA